MSRKKRAAGFTLLEAVICLLLASLLLAIAVPAWSSALVRVHAAVARSALLGSMQAAVNHAATAGTEVVLCPSEGLDCDDTWDWSHGWIAYADINGDRLRDADETIIRRQPALSGDVRLFSSKGRKRLVFQSNGGNAGSNVIFTLCSGHGPNSAATVVLSNAGRLRDSRPDPRSAGLCLAASR